MVGSIEVFLGSPFVLTIGSASSVSCMTGIIKSALDTKTDRSGLSICPRSMDGTLRKQELTKVNGKLYKSVSVEKGSSRVS